MIYKEVIIYIGESARENIVGDLLMLNFESFTDTDEALHAFMPANRWDDSMHGELEKTLKTYRDKGIIQNYKIEVQDIHPQNWQEQWERTIQPIYVGRNIVIHPSWQSIDLSNETIDVIIDPRMSFGTGHHETTQMMIELLEQYIVPGDTILDVGTGSGILAIIAAKMGAASVTGIDNDPDAVNDAIENCRINKLKNVVSIYHGELTDSITDSFDLVIANIERKTILDLFAQLTTHLKPSGKLLLSGLLDEDYPHIEQASSRSNLSILKTVKRQSQTSDTWIAVALQK